MGSNFPEYFNRPARSNQKLLDPEVRALRDWSKARQFVLSGNFEAGGLSTTFPYYNPDYSVITYTKKAETPDNDVFQHLASTYKKRNQKMDQQYICQVV